MSIFYTWNVKQLRPAAINKYDWGQENYVEELWIAEGMTSYCDDLLLVRAGFLSESRCFDMISRSVEEDMTRPGNKRQSLSECSFDAWTKFWKNTQQAYTFETDFYSRGANVSFILDMMVRKHSSNKHSLDTVLRAMYKRFPLGKGGYTNEDFRQVCEEVAGTSLQKFFDDYVNGVKPLPWNEALSVAGLELEEKSPDKKPWLGIYTSDIGGKTVVTRVVEGSPAYESGLNIDDELVALNGFNVSGREPAQRVSEAAGGDTIRITVFRDERLREFEIRLRNNEIQPKGIVKTKNPSKQQEQVLATWLALAEKKERKRNWANPIEYRL